MNGVVIVNYNDSIRAEKLAKILEGYENISIIVIVDNCSTDNSYSRLLSVFKSVEKIDVIKTSYNGGYGYGNNYGAFYLVKKYLVDNLFIANTDVLFSQRFIDVCVDELNSGYSMVTGIMDMNGKRSIYLDDYNINSYKQDLISCFFWGRHRLRNDMQQIDYSCDVLDVEMVPGSLFAIKASDYISCEGFDENIFLYCEERVIGTKLKRMGKKIGLIPCIEYKHLHSTSISKTFSNIKCIKILYQSRLYYWKHYHNISLAKQIILRLGMYISLFEYYFREGVICISHAFK